MGELSLPAFLPSFRFILNSFLFLAIFFSFLSLSSPVLANEDLSAVALAKEEFFLTKIRTATFNCRPAGGNPAQRLAACLPRRVAERLLRGPLDKARKSGKILKQKGWWVGLERFTSITLSFTPLENKVLHLPPHQFYPYKIHI